jgi:lipoate-protein ligase A
MTWALERLSGRAGALHARLLPEPLERTVWALTVDRPAIVLGSAQRIDEVAVPDGADLVRRRSGGGAVWLAPGGTLWVDVLLPRDDPLWDDDVGRSGLWLGEAWAAALSGHSAVVHRGAMQRSPHADAVCFAGLAPGEVTQGPGGPKLVGVSQRRSRYGARFQCVAYETWDPAPLATALGVPVDAVTGAGAGAGDLAVLEREFLLALQRSSTGSS